MRTSLVVLALLVSCGVVRAEPPRVTITAASAGLPDARRAGGPPICKFAAWAPLEVELTITSPLSGPAFLTVETPDADGVMTVLSTPIDAAKFTPGGTIRLQSVIRPAAGSGETTVTIESPAGRAVSDPFRIRSLRPRDSLTYVVLGLGSRFGNFDLPKPATGTGAQEAEPTVGPLRGGRIELAAIDDVERLPDVWFGYETADLVVLSTSSPEFVKRLAERGRKITALAEWLRRGGRLMLASGANATLLNNNAFTELMPARVAGTRQVEKLPLYWAARETSQTTSLAGILAPKSGTFPVATFAPRPDGAARTVIPPAKRPTNEKESIAVQIALGLGRVTLVGIDLDRSPFTEFSRQPEFWDWVLREGGASRASVGSEGKTRQPSTTPTDDEDEVTVALRTHVDSFDAIPVVSFGSVAFLIALYILLVGPIEYYALKRLFGRLELTWLTFPIIVITVCVAAALSAASLKGRDVRVNKIDVIEVVPEPGGGRVYGTSWFTVFSPKIDLYSPAITPAEGWTKSRDPQGTLMGWFAGPRAGRASLLQRKYAYHTDGPAIADSLSGVPVQVWSTKSFTANWEGELDPSSPAIVSHLEHPPGDPTKAIGTFSNNMPFEAVTDCVAFYAGQAYPLGTIVKGQEVRLVLDRGQVVQQWLQDRGQLPDLLSRGQFFSATPAGSKTASALPVTTTTSSTLPLWGLLFHEAALRNDEGVVPRNASVRRLDQSWRLAPDFRDQVIVVGRVLPPTGAADAVFNGPDSPTRLWLKDRPNAGKPSLTGFARQETWVRIYLPVP
jgi:hypothetical protein